MVVMEYTHKKKKINRGRNSGKNGRPKEQTKRKRVSLTFSEDIANYILDYRKKYNRDYSGSQHAEQLIRLGLSFQALIPLLLADRSDLEIQFILSQISPGQMFHFVVEL